MSRLKIQCNKLPFSQKGWISCFHCIFCTFLSPKLSVFFAWNFLGTFSAIFMFVIKFLVKWKGEKMKKMFVSRFDIITAIHSAARYASLIFHPLEWENAKTYLTALTTGWALCYEIHSLPTHCSLLKNQGNQNKRMKSAQNPTVYLNYQLRRMENNLSFIDEPTYFWTFYFLFEYNSFLLTASMYCVRVVCRFVFFIVVRFF